MSIAPYENPEVNYEPETHRYHVVWHKKDSNEVATVTLDPILHGIVE